MNGEPSTPVSSPVNGILEATTVLAHTRETCIGRSATVVVASRIINSLCIRLGVTKQQMTRKHMDKRRSTVTRYYTELIFVFESLRV